MKPADAPRLPGWMTPTEAAEVLGVARQTVNMLIKDGEFASLHLIGPEVRPQYLISTNEVMKLKAERPFPRSPTSGN